MSNNTENILARIPGEYVSAALKALPDCSSAKDDFQESIIDVPGFGKVRFTCKRMMHKHHKSLSVFWTATKAVKAA